MVRFVRLRSMGSPATVRKKGALAVVVTCFTLLNFHICQGKGGGGGGGRGGGGGGRISSGGGGVTSGAQPATTGGVVTGRPVTGNVATGRPVTGGVATGIPVGIGAGAVGANRPFSQGVQQRYTGPYTMTPAGLRTAQTPLTTGRPAQPVRYGGPVGGGYYRPPGQYPPPYRNRPFVNPYPFGYSLLFIPAFAAGAYYGNHWAVYSENGTFVGYDESPEEVDFYDYEMELPPGCVETHASAPSPGPALVPAGAPLPDGTMLDFEATPSSSAAGTPKVAPAPGPGVAANGSRPITFECFTVEASTSNTTQTGAALALSPNLVPFALAAAAGLLICLLLI